MTNKKDNTEIGILEAAKQIFHRKGMAGTRMQEIADKAGINKAMLHYYFRSKQLLFEAVFKQAFGLMAPQLNKIINADIDLELKIRTFVENYIDFVIKHPYLPTFIIQELNRNPDFVVELMTKEYFPDIKSFVGQVDRLVSEGKIREIEPEQLFVNVLSLCIFPFVGKPMLKGFMGQDEKAYQELLKARKKDVGDFIWNAIQLN